MTLSTVALFFQAAPAFAQSDEAVAEVLFKQGRDAFESGNYEKACAKFAESYRIESTLGTQLNLAACEAKRGRVATAWGLFRALQQKLKREDPRAEYVAKNVEDLSPRVPHVTFRLDEGAPSGTQVNLGEVRVQSGAFGEKLPVDPGEHEWVVSAAGYESRTIKAKLAEAENLEVVLAPGAQLPTPAAGAGQSAEVELYLQDTSEDKINRRTLSYVFGGVGIASLASGTVFGVMTLQQKKKGDEQCPSAASCNEEGAKALDRARSYRLVSNVSWAVAAVSIGTAAYFFFTSDDTSQATTNHPAPRTQVGVGFDVVPQGAAFSVSGTFF